MYDDEDEVYIVPLREYEVPWWARWLHALPHLDLTFETVNSSYNLNDPKYRESLMFWVAIPILWLLLTLFLFLVYFCYRCCQQDPGKRRKLSCLKWTLSVLTVLSCGIIGLGIYGNEDTNKGVNNIVIATSDIMFTINKIRMQIAQIHKTTNSTISKGLEEMTSLYKSFSLHRTSRDFHVAAERAQQFARSIQSGLMDILRRLQNLDYMSFVSMAKKYETYRRLATWAAFFWFLVLCLILLAGIGRNSKCTLLMFCAFGIFSLVMSWLFAGVHLGVAVGMGDFCSDPNPVMESYVSDHLEMSVIQYYIKCDSTVAANPFNDILKASMENINEANTSFIKALAAANLQVSNYELSNSKRLMESGLLDVRGLLMSINALVECTNLHKDYVDVVEGVCYFTLPGILFMFLSSVATGLLFSVLVVVSSKTWRVVGIRKSYTDQDDDEGGPFMSQHLQHHHHHHHQAPPSPSYYSFPKNRQTTHIATHNRRTTPPPAYNSNEFYRQYSDMSAPEEGRVDYTIRESNA